MNEWPQPEPNHRTEQASEGAEVSIQAPEQGPVEHTEGDESAEVQGILEKEIIHPNSRIAALMAQVDAAERNLQEALQDLETREQSPAFQRAKEIYESGIRLMRIDDNEGESVLLYGSTPNLREMERSYRVSNLSSDNTTDMSLFRDLELESRQDMHQVVEHLLNLSEEERS